jgi:hypothetical protein
VVIRRTTEVRIVQLGATIQRGLGHGSRGIAIIRSHFQAATSENTTGWKRHVKYGKQRWRCD